MRNMTVKLIDDINSDDSEREDIEEIKIMSEDGRVLYYISMTENGELDVSTGAAAMLDGNVKDTTLTVLPKANNRILLTRPNYK